MQAQQPQGYEVLERVYPRRNVDREPQYTDRIDSLPPVRELLKVLDGCFPDPMRELDDWIESSSTIGDALREADQGLATKDKEGHAKALVKWAEAVFTKKKPKKYAKALTCANKAVEIFAGMVKAGESHDSSARCAALRVQASLLSTTGKHQQALAASQEERMVHLAHGRSSEAAAALTAEGDALGALSRPVEARQTYEKARAEFVALVYDASKRTEKIVVEYGTLLHKLAERHEKDGRLVAAATIFLRAADMFLKPKDTWEELGTEHKAAMAYMAAGRVFLEMDRDGLAGVAFLNAADLLQSDDEGVYCVRMAAVADMKDKCWEDAREMLDWAMGYYCTMMFTFRQEVIGNIKACYDGIALCNKVLLDDAVRKRRNLTPKFDWWVKNEEAIMDPSAVRGGKWQMEPERHKPSKVSPQRPRTLNVQTIETLFEMGAFEMPPEEAAEAIESLKSVMLHNQIVEQYGEDVDWNSDEVMAAMGLGDLSLEDPQEAEPVARRKKKKKPKKPKKKAPAPDGAEQPAGESAASTSSQLPPSGQTPQSSEALDALLESVD